MRADEGRATINAVLRRRQPVVLLTKADLCEDVQSRMLKVETIAYGVQDARARSGTRKEHARFARSLRNTSS